MGRIDVAVYNDHDDGDRDNDDCNSILFTLFSQLTDYNVYSVYRGCTHAFY